MTAIIRRFDRAEPMPPTNEIQLMTAEERKFMSAQVEAEPIATRVALHPFLAGMSHRHLALLTDCAMVCRFRNRQPILREGEFANRFYLIETGRVVLESAPPTGEPVILEAVGPRDLLGWSWMFSPYAWQFSARAVESTTAIFFYGTILREYCEKDHSLGYELFKRVTPVILRRLQAARKQMLCIRVHGASAS